MAKLCRRGNTDCPTPDECAPYGYCPKDEPDIAKIVRELRWPPIPNEMYLPEDVKLHQRAADALTRLSTENALLIVALKKISVGDWAWEGGGSAIRNRGWCGSVAAKALGEPAALPLGWLCNGVGGEPK